LPSESIQAFFLLITQFWIWIDVCARHDDHYPFGNYLDRNSTKQFLGSNGDIGINQPKKIELTLDLGRAYFGRRKTCKSKAKAKQIVGP
jgi:hypothetical protein